MSTRRTIAEVEALLADNTGGDISPLDVRESVLTAAPDYGTIYLTASSATTLSDTTTWVPIAGTWTITGTSYQWDSPSNGRLRYIGDPVRIARVFASVSITAASNNQVLELGVMKNGNFHAPSLAQRKVSTGADVGNAAVMTCIDVSQNDYLQVCVRNTTSASNITATAGNLFSIGLAT